MKSIKSWRKANDNRKISSRVHMQDKIRGGKQRRPGSGGRRG